MSKLKYRRDIDGLRALAILPVIFFHAGIAGFGGGFIGVDIFFVISGYLITSIIVREVNEGSFTYRTFWARRARRILPASIVMVATTLVAGWFLLAPYDYFSLGESARDQAYFAANFYFWQESGYFDGPSELKPLLHTWSLAVEEQFYVFFPVLFIVANRFCRPHQWIVLVAAMLASLLASILLVDEQPSATFYLLHTRAWELLLGSLLAIAPLARPRAEWIYQLLSLLGLAVIAYCVVMYSASTQFPGAAALPPTLATALIIWANGHNDTWVKRLLSIAPLVWFGLISYSLYLWHWPLMAFTRYQAVEELQLIDQCSLAVASIVLGYLSWRFVETPFRKRRWLVTDKKILVATVGCLLLIAVAGQRIRSTEGYPPRLPENVQTYAEASEWERYQKNCYKLKPEQIQAGELCRFGGSNDNVSSDAKLLFWGDSHATAFLPAIRAKSEQYDVLTLHAAKNGCPPIVGGERVDRPDCAIFNHAMAAQLKASGVSHVLLAGRWAAYIFGQSPADDSIMLVKDLSVERTPEAARQIFRTHFKAMVDEFLAHDIHVWLVKQVPLQTQGDMSHILAKRAMRNLDSADIGVKQHEHEARQAFVNSVLEELAGAGVTVFDPTPYLCDKGFCAADRKGYSAYKDDNHLSVKGALMLQNLFDPLFLSIAAEHHATTDVQP
jgi:peptidoglycan/LPS O-acetylase OafA/YrhL